MLARDKAHIDLSRGVVGTYEHLFDIAMREEAQVVLVAYPDRRGTLPVEQLLEVKFPRCGG